MSSEFISKHAVITACRHLRRDSDGSLVPVPAPVVESIPAGYVPVDSFDDLAVARRDNQLAVISHGIPQSSLTLPATPSRVMSLGSRICVAFDSGAAMFIGIDRLNRTLYHIGPRSSQPSVGPFSISLVEADLISADLHRVVLSKQWNESRVLSPADFSKLASAAASAVGELDATAFRRGLIIHPVMVFARLRDSDGRIVRIFSPELLRPTPASALSRTLTLTETNGSSDPLTLTLRSYSLSISASRDWSADYPGCSVEFLAYPFLPMIDPAGRPSVSPRQRADDKHLCTIRLCSGPAAASDDLSTINTAAFIAVADSRRFAPPLILSADPQLSAFPLAARCFNVPRLAAADLKSPARSVPATLAEAYHSSSHAFAGNVAALADDLVLFADTSVSRAPAPSIGDVTASKSSSPGICDAWVAVEFADGSRLVSRSSFADGVPLSLKPFLSYPAPDARSLSIAWWSPVAGHFRIELPLVPDAAGRASVYIHPTGLPFEPPRVNEPFAVPQPLTSPLCFPDTLVAVSASCPSLSLALGRISGGSVIALLPAASRQSSWDYGRSRFIAFTSAGVFSVNVDPARGSMSSSLIDRRCLARAADAVAVPRGVVAVIGSELLLISGSKVSVLASDVAGRVPVWCPDYGGELWLLGPLDTLVLNPDSPSERYTMDFVASRASGQWLSADAEYFLPRHGPGLLVPVCFQAFLPVERHGPGTRRLVDFRARGSFSDLRLNLYRSSLSQPAAAPDLRLIVSGRLIGPLRRAFAAPPASQFFVSLEGLASSRARFYNLSLL